jgi:CDP-4-dehydro-6-deoxyglucose reductase, E1
MKHSIPLAQDTITQTELESLSKWMLGGSQLTKGELTKQFEREFADYIGTPHAVFVNSGSSANLLMLSALKEGGFLKNTVAIVPAVSWITTLSPFLQLGFEAHLCDSDPCHLGFDLNHFEELCKKYNPSVAILVHVLGHSNQMKELIEICDRYGVYLLEDSCEALGTLYQGKMLGSFGIAGSFSFYYGHHLSTIEGGVVTTNDNKLYNYMLSIRSHGWARDVEPVYQKEWAEKYEIDEFRNLYTFYNTGYNLRSTDLNAFLGLSQIKKAEEISKRRSENFVNYIKHLEGKYFVQNSDAERVSSFAFGTLVENRLDVYKHLKAHGVESRPLICGSLGRQPFWIRQFGQTHLPVADLVHDYGIYLPNHLYLDEEKIAYVSALFKDVAIPKFMESKQKILEPALS